MQDTGTSRGGGAPGRADPGPPHLHHGGAAVNRPGGAYQHHVFAVGPLPVVETKVPITAKNISTPPDGHAPIVVGSAGMEESQAAHTVALWAWENSKA